jgi:hypothetical protein
LYWYRVWGLLALMNIGYRGIFPQW